MFASFAMHVKGKMVKRRHGQTKMTVSVLLHCCVLLLSYDRNVSEKSVTLKFGNLNVCTYPEVQYQ
jgi:hypothetical protein